MGNEVSYPRVDAVNKPSISGTAVVMDVPAPNITGETRVYSDVLGGYGYPHDPVTSLETFKTSIFERTDEFLARRVESGEIADLTTETSDPNTLRRRLPAPLRCRPAPPFSASTPCTITL
jgi:hypothetical protein